MYTNIRRRLRGAVRKKRPEKWRNNGWFLLHDKAATNRLVTVGNFFIKEQYDSTGASPILS